MILLNKTEESCVLRTPAKVNLFLHVLNRRPDGYHNLSSLFQAVSLFDELVVTRTAEPGCRIDIVGAPDLSTGDDNLISRAFRLLAERYQIDGGVAVRLTKRIPMQAGLGGGSSDAAAMMAAAVLLFDLKVPYDELARLGLEVGSDVPFFFHSGQGFVTGRGEVVEPTAFPLNYRIVLVKPPISVSTGPAFHALKRGLTFPESAVKFLPDGTIAGFFASLLAVRNDFEEAHLKSFPELGRVKDGLLRHGAQVARLTGSGPTFFGLFPKEAEPPDLDELEQAGNQLFVVEPVLLPAMW